MASTVFVLCVAVVTFAERALQGPSAEANEVRRSLATDPFDERQLSVVFREALFQFGGPTIDPLTHQPVQELDVWAVSREQFEAQFHSLPSLADVTSYIHKHKALFSGPDQLCLGSWRDEVSGRSFFDLTELISDLPTAVTRGRENNQQCIYNLSTGKEVRVPQWTSAVQKAKDLQIE